MEDKLTTPKLYVGKEYSDTKLLCVDLKGNGLTGTHINLEHPEKDTYAAGTFLEAVFYVAPKDMSKQNLDKHTDVLNDMCDSKSYAEAIAKFEYNPLHKIATISINLKDPNHKETLLSSLKFLQPNHIIFQGFEAKELFADKQYREQIIVSCEHISICMHPTDKKYATPMQQMGGGMNLKVVEEYMWSTLKEDLLRQQKRPLRNIDGKMRVVKEPSLVGKMLLEFARIKPDSGYTVCRIDSNQPHEVSVIRHFENETDAKQFQKTRPYNTIIIEAKQNKMLVTQ